MKHPLIFAAMLPLAGCISFGAKPPASLLNLTGLWLDLELVLGCKVTWSPVAGLSPDWPMKSCVTPYPYEVGSPPSARCHRADRTDFQFFRRRPAGTCGPAPWRSLPGLGDRCKQ